MGFGTGPFGATPFGTAPVSPAEEPGRVLSSSRNIDGKTKRYTLDDDGNYDGMHDTAQRVLLLLAYECKEPTVIGVDFEGKMRSSIRAALAPLTSGREPSIRLEKIEVSAKAGTSFKRVVFFDLKRNQRASVSF